MSTVTSSQYNYLNGTYFPTPFHLQQQPSQPYSAPPVVPPVYSAPAAVPDVYSLPQYLQTQQLFQRVAQTITPEAIENVKAALARSELEQKAEVKKKAVPRKAAGQTWEDPTLAEWPENDFRLFCGNLGNEVNDDVLSKAFSRFPSFNMARGSMLGTDQFNFGRVSGKIGLTMKLWQDRRMRLKRKQSHQRRAYCTSDRQTYRV
ncbi:RNA-binding protein 42-like isoform X2 [Solanum pennellii]|uniref:RNA-binding protein 42-like isoform X2 n=1 Tax=Solanum pennellii TaxID=28526 RepID=A0ABM1VAR7_SOLPN|nr:RNA-binding protein 42-like isoform X2 [Solanum pennellii]